MPTSTAVPAGRSALMPLVSASGVPRALDQRIEVVAQVVVGAGSLRGAGAAGELEPVRVDVGDGDVGRAERDRGLHRQLADRPGAGDQHLVARGDARLAAGPHADRQRLHQRALLVGELVGEREREVLVDRHELRERAVDRRRGEEDDVGAEVVAAGAALAAAPTRHARLERHAVADGVLRGALAELDHAARRLVPEDQRRLDDERADAAVLVVVDVGAADADRGDLDQHLARARAWGGRAPRYGSRRGAWRTAAFIRPSPRPGSGRSPASAARRGRRRSSAPPRSCRSRSAAPSRSRSA